MDKDFDYCSGIGCKIKHDCKRYLPSPPNQKLTWLSPQYSHIIKDCIFFIHN